jgi:hypothetical protein
MKPATITYTDDRTLPLGLAWFAGAVLVAATGFVSVQDMDSPFPRYVEGV